MIKCLASGGKILRQLCFIGFSSPVQFIWEPRRVLVTMKLIFRFARETEGINYTSSGMHKNSLSGPRRLQIAMEAQVIYIIITSTL